MSPLFSGFRIFSKARRNAFGYLRTLLAILSTKYFRPGWCVAVALGLERLLTWARAASPATLAKSPAPLARCSGPLAPLLRLGLLATLAFSSARLLGRNTVWQSRATLFRSDHRPHLLDAGVTSVQCPQVGAGEHPRQRQGVVQLRQLPAGPGTSSGCRKCNRY